MLVTKRNAAQGNSYSFICQPLHCLIKARMNWEQTVLALQHLQILEKSCETAGLFQHHCLLAVFVCASRYCHRSCSTRAPSHTSYPVGLGTQPLK